MGILFQRNARTLLVRELLKQRFRKLIVHISIFLRHQRHSCLIIKSSTVSPKPSDSPLTFCKCLNVRNAYFAWTLFMPHSSEVYSKERVPRLHQFRWRRRSVYVIHYVNASILPSPGASSGSLGSRRGLGEKMRIVFSATELEVWKGTHVEERGTKGQ